MCGLQGYKVYYTLTPELPVSLWTVHEVSDNSLLTTITNLVQDRTYSLRVLAFTDVGDGPLSRVISVNTSAGRWRCRNDNDYDDQGF